MGHAFHELCLRYSGTLTLTAPTAKLGYGKPLPFYKAISMFGVILKGKSVLQINVVYCTYVSKFTVVKMRNIVDSNQSDHLGSVRCGSVLFALFPKSGPGCSKLTTLLANLSLKFQALLSQICQ